jgi:NADH-quinone oxidoreductase subunit M
LALAQRDIKRLIAYSSVSHLGFCMLGLFTLNSLGFFGGTLQMINHGISTGALFALVGMMYERYHTRRIEHLSGLARRMPFLAFFFVLFALSSIGLPGTNGFAGEFLLLLGMFQRAWVEISSPQHMVIAVLALSGVVLGAWYMLWLVQRMLFGPLKEPSEAVQRAAASPLAPREGDPSRSEGQTRKGAGDWGLGVGGGEPRSHTDDATHPTSDLSWRERIALVPLAVMVLWIGVYPQFFLSRMSGTLEGLLEHSVSGPAPDPGPSRQTASDTPREKPIASPLSALRAFAVENSALENLAVGNPAVARKSVNDPSLPEAPAP